MPLGTATWETATTTTTTLSGLASVRQVSMLYSAMPERVALAARVTFCTQPTPLRPAASAAGLREGGRGIRALHALRHARRRGEERRKGSDVRGARHAHRTGSGRGGEGVADHIASRPRCHTVHTVRAASVSALASAQERSPQVAVCSGERSAATTERSAASARPSARTFERPERSPGSARPSAQQSERASARPCARSSGHSARYRALRRALGRALDRSLA